MILYPEPSEKTGGIQSFLYPTKKIPVYLPEVTEGLFGPFNPRNRAVPEISDNEIPDSSVSFQALFPF
ncbi:MAG: hypothetical protein NTW50_03720 [Candidatus Berkelbacteria bacterium]|nr:hypothetical protein [Candidatus Berkelbacteria bacterium]